MRLLITCLWLLTLLSDILTFVLCSRGYKCIVLYLQIQSTKFTTVECTTLNDILPKNRLYDLMKDTSELTSLVQRQMR